MRCWHIFLLWFFISNRDEFLFLDESVDVNIRKVCLLLVIKNYLIKATNFQKVVFSLYNIPNCIGWDTQSLYQWYSLFKPRSKSFKHFRDMWFFFSFFKVTKKELLHPAGPLLLLLPNCANHRVSDQPLLHDRGPGPDISQDWDVC